jgi:hypothetical protein
MKALAAASAFAMLVSIPLHAAETWQEQRAVPDEASAGSQFGCAASLDGTLALIGADGENGSHGAAYFYEKSDAGWTEKQRIEPDDPTAAEFGFRTFLKDDVAIVTADMSGPNGNTGQGSGYVFERDDAGTWSQTQILIADDGAGFDNFGSAIALDGDRLVIGAHGAQVGDNFAQGAAYFFQHTDAGWVQAQKILADDGALNDNFGQSAAMVGDTLFIGANGATIDGAAFQGAVYVFHFDGDAWVQVQKLAETEGAMFDYFGLSVAFDGTKLLVGATQSGSTGAVYAFTNDGSSWVEQQRLTVDDLFSFADFGNAIALHGDDALIASDVQTVDGSTSRGAAYLFHFDGTSWSLDHTFVASDGTTDDFFGNAVAYDGTTALISTLHPNGFEGAAYFYTNDSIFADGFDG